ncbi:TetR/AcrR family transcriptional regulator [Pseudonocardia alaniniphila]|uniref:TetR/AcrR family transcriptional regulator n=1 Tax=Pseudonocardia alaniniphila TaxID=75291 RepID=A0ABS9T993_9PSEU|nr:TetR/AcrR family transcriptional regulator [Pseudonocardia alaniniphila]MCH6165094.1 TetR/AcrR family transcriptional regulator [Pseudonocardia alaniniphila]
MRKTPSQARGRERVDRILVAAAEEFAVNGFDVATVSAIATRAGASIGSVYQFFGDKESILDALLQRYRADLSEMGADVAAAAAARQAAGTGEGPGLEESLGPVVDRLVFYCRRNPAFPTLLARASRHTLAGESVHRTLRDVVARILAVKQPDPQVVARMAAVLTDIVAGLLPSATADDELVLHLKAAMVGYLGQITAGD